MDPFRDELAAAHAKIAKLEADVTALKERASPSAEKVAPKTMLDSRVAWFVAGILFSIFVAAGFLLGKSDTASRGAMTDAEFRELATHPPPAPDLFSSGPADSASR